MYCKHCGKEIADDSKFCQHCGGKQFVEGQSKYINESIKVKRQIFQPPLIKRIIFVILGFIACVPCAYFPLEQNIEKDAQRIIEEDSIKYREEAIHRLDSVFERTGKDNFGCILYYNMLPNYEYVPNSKRNEVFPNKEVNELQQLSDLNTIYHLSPKIEEIFEEVEYRQMLNSIWLANIDRGERALKPLDGYKKKQRLSFWQSGWVIGYAQRTSEDSYSCFLVYPYMVGYYGSENASSVEISDEIESALDFFTNNKKSFVYGYILDKNIHEFRTLATRDGLGAGLFSYIEDTSKKQYGMSDCISNGTRRVYIKSSLTRDYVLKYCNEWDEQTKNNYIIGHRNKLIQILGIIIGTLTLLLIILLCVYYKMKRITKENQQNINTNNLLNKALETKDSIETSIKEELKTDTSSEASNEAEIVFEIPTETDGNQKSKQRTSQIIFVIFSAIFILISLFFIPASHFGFNILLVILTLVILLYRIILKKDKLL